MVTYMQLRNDNGAMYNAELVRHVAAALLLTADYEKHVGGILDLANRVGVELPKPTPVSYLVRLKLIPLTYHSRLLNHASASAPAPEPTAPLTGLQALTSSSPCPTSPSTI
jgi:hypothetical protein